MNDPKQQIPVGTFDQSGAGEEDPGAAVEPTLAVPPKRPADEAAAGTPGTGETICRACGGTGRDETGAPCPECEGTGRITAGIGGG